MAIIYQTSFLEEVSKFLESIDVSDHAKILAMIERMKIGDFSSIYVKKLRGRIMELIVKKYRIVFFIEKGTIFFVGAFIKKTAKTPLKEIKNAKKIHKLIMET